MGHRQALRPAREHDLGLQVRWRQGLVWIFERFLVGYLERNTDVFEMFDVIIPMPTYVGPEAGARSWDHIATIVERAEVEGPQWPFRRDIMIKTIHTPTMVGLTFRQRAEVAEQQIRPALRVDEPAAVTGKMVLVFDGVFTGALTLREVAFKLKASGATCVAGIVLARQPIESSTCRPQTRQREYSSTIRCGSTGVWISSRRGSRRTRPASAS
jgi:hypothetical protein